MALAGFAKVDTDVVQPGAIARPSYGAGASLYYRGNLGVVQSPDVLANKFQSLWEFSDLYRKKFMPDILESYSQFNAEIDNQTKEAWQSNIFVPLPMQAINVAAGRIVSALFQTTDFFEVAPDRKSDDQLTDFAKKSTLWAIAKADGREQIKVSVKDALICGIGPMKVHYAVCLEPYTDTEWHEGRGLSVGGEILPALGKWDFVSKQIAKKRLRLEPIIPTDVWFDPTGKNRYVIHRMTRYVSDLWEGTKDIRDPDTGQIVRRAVYDPRQVQRVTPGMHDTQRQIEAARIRRDLATPYGLVDNTVDVYELWGDFPDVTTGAILYKNVVATFVDRRVTIRMPMVNPLRHQMSPFVIFTSQLLPHQVYPYGLLYQNRRIMDAINRQANVISDKAMLQVPTLEYDRSASADPRAFQGDRPRFAPGKMWPRRPGPDKKIFYPVEGFQPVTPMDLAVLDRYTNWYATGSMVSEFATGQQLSNNRKTKAEVQGREQASLQNFNDAAVHMEAYAITPLLRRIYLTLIQYEDSYDDTDLQRMFGDDQDAQTFLASLKSMSPAQRWKALYLDSEFKAVGITNEITRQKELQEAISFAQTVASDPLLGMFINKVEQLEQLRRHFRQSPRMVLDNADQIIQQMQMAMLQNQLTGGQGGPQAPAGQPGGTPGSRPATNPHNAQAAVQAEAGRAA